jgi:hypothetical protein
MANTFSPAGWKPDQRLIWLIAAALLLVAAEFGVRGWELHQQLETDLKKVQRNAAALSAGSDGIDWAGRTRLAQRERTSLQARLWQVPSEAQAQARLRDWLTNALRSAGVNRPSINLLPAVGVASGATSIGASPGAGAAPNAAEGGATASSSVQKILHTRATVGFDLAAGALENALLQIEAGGQLAQVENLSVSTRSRRVEMTVSVPVWLKGKERP